jgi:uncharacterized protein
MKILLDDIEATPKELSYTEAVGALNAALARGAHDYQVPDGYQVDVEYYRAGLEVFFEGGLHATVVGTCARCLEEYRFPLDQRFRFVLMPRAAGGHATARLTADDLALSTYDGDEIDLTPLVDEQAILALPTRPLCREGCLGLCPRCGANLNAGPCGCPPREPDPRLAILHTLVRGDK